MDEVTVYSVSDGEGTYYCPTVKEARELLRETLKVDEYAYANRHVVTGRLKRRELYCQLLNGESWQESQEEILP